MKHGISAPCSSTIWKYFWWSRIEATKTSLGIWTNDNRSGREAVRFLDQSRHQIQQVGVNHGRAACLFRQPCDLAADHVAPDAEIGNDLAADFRLAS
ncbi:MAG: hypothetical protein Ct9H300mP16_01310 [Pseudomonadota bacterium]|nr:MAG: hypothetical protein Ct9H300mP16_01310 [Pseudomonadota bacterium]